MIYLLSIDHPHGHLTAGSFRLLLNALIGGANVLDLLYWIRQANLEIVLSLFLDYSYTIKIAGFFLQKRAPFNTNSSPDKQKTVFMENCKTRLGKRNFFYLEA